MPGARTVLRGELDNLRCGEAPVAIWSDDDFSDAVYIPVRHGCFPAAILALHRVTRDLGGEVGVAADGVLLFGVLPALADA